MPKVYALTTCFQFPVFGAWKVETYTFQWFKYGAMAVSGLLSNCRRKPKFSPLNLLKTLSFQFPEFPPLRGTGNRRPDRPTWARVPLNQQKRCRHERKRHSMYQRALSAVPLKVLPASVQGAVSVSVMPLCTPLNKVSGATTHSVKREVLSVLESQSYIKGWKTKCITLESLAQLCVASVGNVLFNSQLSSLRSRRNGALMSYSKPVTMINREP